MKPSLEGWPTKAKEATSPHEVRLTPTDTKPVFQYLPTYIEKKHHHVGKKVANVGIVQYSDT